MPGALPNKPLLPTVRTAARRAAARPAAERQVVRRTRVDVPFGPPGGRGQAGGVEEAVVEDLVSTPRGSTEQPRRARQTTERVELPPNELVLTRGTEGPAVRRTDCVEDT